MCWLRRGWSRTRLPADAERFFPIHGAVLRNRTVFKEFSVTLSKAQAILEAISKIASTVPGMAHAATEQKVRKPVCCEILARGTRNRAWQTS